MKKDAITIVVVVLFLFFGLFSQTNIEKTGKASSYITIGCCESICQITTEQQCEDSFYSNQECEDIDNCNLGCCVDTEGYCLNNYLQGNCNDINGDFVEIGECLYHPPCVSSSTNQLMGSVGYPEIYSESEYGLISINLESAIKGDNITIKFNVFDKSQDISVRIYFDDYEYIMDLYDDGKHDDQDNLDDIYANLWDSSLSPYFEGIKKINIDVQINEKIIDTDYFSLTENGCLPLTKQWEDPNLKQDVIFVILDPLYGDYTSLVIMDQINSNNFYTLEKDVSNFDDDAIKNQVTQKCDFYDQNEDVIIILDSNFSYCEQKQGTIRTNPQFEFNQDIQNITDNFCSDIKTYQEISDESLASFEPPNVTIISPKNNTHHKNSNITLSLLVEDNNEEDIQYLVYSDLAMIKDDTISINEVSQITVNLVDGAHTIFIELEDSDGNKGYSEFLDILVNSSNFIIEVYSLSEFFYNESPNIEFKINHIFNGEMNYIIAIDDLEYSNGTIVMGQIKNIPTNLTNGAHKIQILAKDSNGKISYSPEYVIYIGDIEDY